VSAKATILPSSTSFRGRGRIRSTGDRHQLLALALIIPAALVVVAAMIVPLGYALLMSLFDYRLGAESKGSFLFLANYLRFAQDRLAINSLGITILFTFCAVSCEIVLGVGMAVLLASLPAAAARFLRGLYCMPLLVSPIIVGLLWRYMYDPTFGLIYYFLGLTGLANYFGGLQEPGWAIFCVMIADI